MSPCHVVGPAEDRNGPKHQATIIHTRWRDGNRNWPPSEDQNEDQVCTRECVYENSKYAPAAPRTPDKVAAVAGEVGDVAMVAARVVAWVLDGTGTAPPQKESASHEVGRVEGGKRKRNDVVEGDWGADTDEAKKDVEDRGRDDGVGWDGALRINLQNPSQSCILDI